MNAIRASLASAPRARMLTRPCSAHHLFPRTARMTDIRTWHLGPAIPQTGHRLLCTLGHAGMRLAGWRFSGAFPNCSRFVVIVAPHTSNWDFPILLLAKWALMLDVKWMGKDAIFRPPLGWFMRAVGGIAIERDGTHNVVDRSIRAFAERERMVLLLAPEGTRKRVTAWKSGFWHIAHGAGVPVVCVALDYARRTIRLGPAFDTHDDNATAGIARVRASYAGVIGRRPEMQG
jgi:1-acyl-sn-glycerol-3-phosphate acyltransferase